MTSRRPTADGDDLRQMREEMAELRAIIERQQQRIDEQQQQIEQQWQQAEQQQVEITALHAERVERAERAEVAPSATPLILPSRLQQGRIMQEPGRNSANQRTTSRRRLLACAGAAAAAATVTLVASEGHGAQAAPAPDTSNLVIGTSNTGTSQTSLAITGSSSASPFFQVDASLSTTSNAAAIKGISTVSGGTGVWGVGGTGSVGIGVQGSGNTGVLGSTTVSTGTGVSGNGGATGTGVLGNVSGSGYGVYGSSSSGTGVYGISTDGFGMWGNSTNTSGVRGDSANYYGVFGYSGNYAGVAGYCTSAPDLFAAGGGRIRQLLQGSAGAPTIGTYSAGEMVRDVNGELWLCVSPGSPGHWVQASHAVYGYTGGATSYLSKPIRLLDTRSGATDALTNGGGSYSSGGSPYPVTIAGVSFMSVTVPSSCAGAIGNVTVVAGGGGGYLALVPHGAGFSGTANLAYSAGQIVSNSFNVGLSSDGKLDIIIGGNPTDVILDLFAVVA